ncbi:MAG: rod-binding protein [Rickettsiales bacterium]|nr:rod-binding protein [Rickettsiales bacterium]
MIVNVDRAKALADQTRMKLDQARKSGGKTGGNEAIEKAAQEFEAVFLAQMMEHMFAEVDFDPSNEGPGEDIYKSMMIDEYGKLMSRSGGIGVADHVKREMLRVQEGGAAVELAATPKEDPAAALAAAKTPEEVQ